MQRRKIIPTGTRFGILTVLGEDKERTGNGKVYYLCKCDCGAIKSIIGTSLRYGSSRSCGCRSRDVHRKEVRNVDGPLYKTWVGIKQRCNNPKSNSYKNYGGRGITVCEEWENSYSAFENWSFTHGYVKGLTIDRIDNDKGYSPDNCRFVSHSVNSRNKRTSHMVTINGVTKNLYDWADDFGIEHITMTHRWKRGWRGVKLISPPDYKFRNSLAKCEMNKRYTEEFDNG